MTPDFVPVGSPGTPVPPTDSSCLTVSDLVRLFMSHGLRGLADSTCNTYRQYLKPFAARFGDTPCFQLRMFDVFMWIGTHRGWRSPSTLATVDKCIKRVFNWSRRFELIDRNPVAGLPTPSESRRRNWKDRELIRVIRTSTPAFRRVCYFLAWTGCRPGELRSIQWNDIDWERSCVVLTKHKTLTTQSTPKPRTIMLVPVAVRLLRWIQKHRNHGMLVFLNDHEKPWTPANMCRRIERARNKLVLPKDVKIYGIRHLFGTQAIRRGLDVKTLSLLLGHDSTKHTERYIHLAGDTSHLLNAAKQATGKLR